MNGIIFCVYSTSAISVPPIVLKWCRKERKKIQGEERVTAKWKPMMNLVSRCTARDPNVLASTASESQEKTISKSNTSELVEWPATKNGEDLWWTLAHQTTQNGTLTKSALLKSGNLGKQERGRSVRGQQFTQDTDKFVIDDDDMDSDTDTESNFSLMSRSFLHRVNYRLRKILDHSSKDAMQDIDKRSLILGMFMSSTLEAFVFMGKNYSENLHSIKKTENNLTLKQMFEKSEKL